MTLLGTGKVKELESTSNWEQLLYKENVQKDGFGVCFKKKKKKKNCSRTHLSGFQNAFDIMSHIKQLVKMKNVEIAHKF